MWNEGYWDADATEEDMWLRRREYESAIMDMIAREFPGPFEHVIEGDGDIIMGDDEGVWSPFLYTVVTDALEIVETVLDTYAAGVDDGLIAVGMRQAERYEAKRCMALFVCRGAPPPPPTSRSWPILHKLLVPDMERQHAYGKTKLLLDDGYIDIEQTDDSGATAFAKAVASGLIDCALLLLDRGANPMAPLPDGRTALYALWDHPDASLPWMPRRYLLEVRGHSAVLTGRSLQAYTPYSHAQQRTMTDYETPAFVHRCRTICDAAQGVVTPCLAGRDAALPRLEERALAPLDWDVHWQRREERIRAVGQFVVGTDPECRMLDAHFVELMDMMLPLHSLERL